MMQKAAALYDAGAPGAGEASNMAKYAAAEAAIHCVDRAIQTHGGNGFALEYGLSGHVVGSAPDPYRARLAGDDPQLRRRALARLAEELLSVAGRHLGPGEERDLQVAQDRLEPQQVLRAALPDLAHDDVVDRCHDGMEDLRG